LSRPSRRPLALAVALALAGCAVGPDFVAPRVEAPEAWGEPSAEAGDAEASLAAWWTRFGDPQLTRLVERGARANLELRAADARVREAQALRRASFALLWPTLDVGAATRSEAGGAGAPVDGVFAALDAAWQLDVFGGTRRAVEAADADLAARAWDRRALALLLVGEIARSYIELRGAEAQRGTVERNLAAQREIAELTLAQRRAGLASDLDVERARALVAVTAAELPPLDALRRASGHRLGVLLGVPPTALAAELASGGPIPSAPADPIAGLPADLLRRRPDLVRAERELAAATARVGVAEADLYPRVALLGSVGVQSLSWNHAAGVVGAGPSVTWPVFAAGRIRANVAAADARHAQALARYEQAVLLAFEDVENWLARHAAEQLRRNSLRDAVAANREAAELARRLWANGLGGFLDVLVAERSLLEAESRLVASETALSTSRVALYVALGGGWQQAEELRLP
jgi:NodT family efflux transporter outer membrane factor (OMF) lipoprotein